jgi:hypothetical protein
MKALILNSKVVDIQENSFDVHESMSWVDCGSDVEVGDTYENDQFIKPPIAVLDYSIERRMNYPQLADFADAYYWAQEGDDSKMREYLQKIKEIKEKYPKG